MSQNYTAAELAELRAAIREEVRSELQASERSQHGLVAFLRMVGLHVLARTVANLTYQAWQQFRKMIGWS